MTDIWIMRIGHRPHRDKRVTTHVALSSRALGAKGIYVDAEDRVLEKNIKSVSERFGGDFEVYTGVKWKEVMKGFTGTVIHLTMYGRRLDEALAEIPSNKNLMIIVGAEKVPPEVYERADLNVSVGNQPHSEIAALSIFMDRLTGGKTLYEGRGGRFTVIPNDRGKKIVEISE
jgi:tRNA (cytidine56-2'-O)-methyltransferase